MTIRYTYTRQSGEFIYQRTVPRDLIDRYPGRTVKVPLKTADPIRAARAVASSTT